MIYRMALYVVERLYAWLWRLNFGDTDTDADTDTDTDADFVFTPEQVDDEAFAHPHHGFVVHTRTYMYIATTDGHTWALPFEPGTLVRFSVGEPLLDAEPTHGCTFKGDE